MNDAATPEVPGVTDLVVIGRGGFGVVYRGRQEELSRDVAVKVLLAPGADPKAVERWRREITAMGRLSNHPNIVAVYSAGVTDDGHPYLLMPYLAGGSLHDRIVRSGPLTGDEAIRIGSRLAGGLAAAHAAGVLHRDLKPANVLMSEYDEPQLSDFGIARLVDSATTTTGSVTATIGYAAPEILSGEQATETSDVYGLAATLHAALSGAAPFAGTDGEAMIGRVGRVLTQPPPDLRPLGVAPGLVALLEAALSKSPEDRPPTADALREALEGLSTAGADGPDTAATVVGAAAVVPPPERTAVQAPIAADAAPPSPAPPVAPVPPPAAAPPAGPRSEPPSDPRRNRGVLVAAGLFAVLLLAAAVAFALTRGDGDDDPVVADTTTSTTAPAETAPPETEEETTTTAAEEETTSTTTTTTTTTTEAVAPTDAEISSEDLEAAASNYYDVIRSGDLESSYALLSPAFQQEQDYGTYERFWTETVTSVDVQGRPRADADDLTTDLTLRYGLPDGGQSVENVRLTFTRAADGSLLIDDYAVEGDGGEPNGNGDDDD